MTPIRALLFFIAAAAALPARAQVIEIGADGAVATYARPTVFGTEAPAPVRPVAAPVRSDPLDGVAAAHGLAPGLLRAIVWRESRGRDDAVSAKGALGAMQLMPATAALLGVDPRDPAQNLAGGALYLRQQIDRFGTLPLALAAYNAGPGAVVRYGGVPPFAETRRYVAAILARWRSAGQVQVPANPLLIEVPTL